MKSLASQFDPACFLCYEQTVCPLREKTFGNSSFCILEITRRIKRQFGAYLRILFSFKLIHGLGFYEYLNLKKMPVTVLVAPDFKRWIFIVLYREINIEGHVGLNFECFEKMAVSLLVQQNPNFEQNFSS